jgi:hypothetical protein
VGFAKKPRPASRMSPPFKSASVLLFTFLEARERAEQRRSNLFQTTDYVPFTLNSKFSEPEALV